MRTRCPVCEQIIENAEDVSKDRTIVKFGDIVYHMACSRYAELDAVRLNKVLDDILRQVVCDCGNYRHHGLGWMPAGSGEGQREGREILRKAGLC